MFLLPKLKYEYNSLEPHIDARTMEIHHTKHHAGYVDKLNTAIKGTEWESESIEEILANVSKLDRVIRNNAGGHWNHSFFWDILSPNGGGQPEGALLELINKTFGSFEEFKNKFEESALGVFGSGWTWLVLLNGELKIVQTTLQDNPLMDNATDSGMPLLGIDVWEHAYYLNYQNKRAEYVKAFWNVVNWEKVSELLKN